jgi:hypothetical protein
MQRAIVASRRGFKMGRRTNRDGLIKWFLLIAAMLVGGAQKA